MTTEVTAQAPNYEATARTLRWGISEALARGALDIAVQLARALLSVEHELGVAAQA